MSENPPPLVSPVSGLDVRAVLDQDAAATAGLAVHPDGRRAVLLIANRSCSPAERDSFLVWGGSLTQIAASARVAAVVDYGCTDDGRPYLATDVAPSLADQFRRIGQPAPHQVCAIGATIADALAAGHARGLVHGAVSPATVLVHDDGFRLGGYGVTAPGLTDHLGVWAFTAPEHRRDAAIGHDVATPAGDVFALAATMCVGLVGVLPWSDPTTWADAADLPTGPSAPLWVQVLRAALSPDPDLRPTARELATALRVSAPAPQPGFLGPKVDLRGLIPRAARRLAAISVDAMADGVMPASGRAAASTEAIRFRRTRLALRRHGKVLAVAAIAVVLIAWYGIHQLGGQSGDGGGTAIAYGTNVSAATRALMSSARAEAESFLHRVGSGDAKVCTDVHGTDNITTPTSPAPITCAYLMAHGKLLLSPDQRAAMRDAHVLQAVGISSGSLTGENVTGSNPEPNAFVSLPFVPSLTQVLNRLEITMTYHDGKWWVVQVTFA